MANYNIEQITMSIEYLPRRICSQCC